MKLASNDGEGKGAVLFQALVDGNRTNFHNLNTIS